MRRLAAWQVVGRAGGNGFAHEVRKVREVYECE